MLIINEKAKYSGYYLYDEQFLRLNGKRHYRLTIYDSVNEIPISEKIVQNRSPNIIKQFIKESLDNKPLIAITTDLYPMYRNIFDDLNIKQQLCIIDNPPIITLFFLMKIKNTTRKLKTSLELRQDISKILNTAST
jgi:hypothetical protein